MGDMQFDGTQEEWDALVNKNKSKSMTALEWLQKQLNINGSGAVKTFPELFEQAKEMEKEQLNIARIDGINLANKRYGSKGSNGISFHNIKSKIKNMDYADKFDYFFLRPCGILFLVLLLLKITTIITASWWVVFIPIIIPILVIWWELLKNAG